MIRANGKGQNLQDHLRKHRGVSVIQIIEHHIKHRLSKVKDQQLQFILSKLRGILIIQSFTWIFLLICLV